MLALVLSLTAFVGCSNEPADTGADTADGGEAAVLVGTANGFGGELTVEVTTVDGEITNVEVTDHEESVDEMDPVAEAVEAVPAAIVEAGSTDVEVTSGATVTSTAIIEAVDAALAAE